MLIKVTGTGRTMWCPGCQDVHVVSTAWDWDGSEDAPTFSPSIKVTGVQWPADSEFYRAAHAAVPAGQLRVCHAFVRAGQWEFLPDSTHALAGQTVPMVALPEWVRA